MSYLPVAHLLRRPANAVQNCSRQFCERPKAPSRKGVPHDCMDAGGRATLDAKAENEA